MNPQNLYGTIDRANFFISPRQILRTLNSKKFVLLTSFVAYLGFGNIYFLFLHTEYWTAKSFVELIDDSNSTKQLNILAEDLHSQDFLNDVLINFIKSGNRLSDFVPQGRVKELIPWLKKNKDLSTKNIFQEHPWQELTSYLAASLTSEMHPSKKLLVIKARTKKSISALHLATVAAHTLERFHYEQKKRKSNEVSQFILEKIDKLETEIQVIAAEINNSSSQRVDNNNNRSKIDALMRNADIKAKLLKQLREQLGANSKNAESLTFDAKVTREPYLVDDYARPMVFAKALMVGFGGLVFTLVLLLIKTLVFYRVRFLSDLRNVGIKPLGEIPRVKGATTKSPLFTDYTSEQLVSHFTRIGEELRRRFEKKREVKKRGQILLVTGPLISSGKTMVAANMALEFAQAGFKTLLIDCDMRIPSVAAVFDLPDSTPGLDALQTDQNIPESYQVTISKNLKVLCCPPGIKDPSQLLDSHRLRSYIRKQRKSFDYVLIDSPPSLAVNDAAQLAPISDGAVMVVGYRHCFPDEIKKTFEDLRLTKRIGVYGIINYSEQWPILQLEEKKNEVEVPSKVVS